MNKHVFKKIAELEKTELSEIQIELGAIDDLKKSTENLKKLASDFYEERLVIVQQVKTAKSKADNYLSESQKIEALLNNIKKQFNDLGLNSNENKDVYNAELIKDNDQPIKQALQQLNNIKIV